MAQGVVEGVTDINGCGEGTSRELLLPHDAVYRPPDDGSAVNVQEQASWYFILAVCSVGFFINCQPSEPYLSLYLETVKNMSDTNLERSVWPADTYATLVALPLVGLLAEVLGYRAVIAAGLACREATRLILIFGTGVGPMVAMQITYAAATSVNVVYFAYVYMVFRQVDYQRATACIHAAYHVGNALGSGLGQVLVTYGKWPLLRLFYLSLAFTTMGVLCFVFLLPKPRHKAPASLARMVLEDGPRLALRQLRDLYNMRVLQWTLWWLLGYSMQQIIANYYAVQFTDRDQGGAFGVVELIMEIGAALGSIVPSLVRASLDPWTTPVLLATSVIKGVVWLLTTVVMTALASYSFNTAAFAINAFQEATGSAVIASSLRHSRYAVVFTANAFAALAISSVVLALGTATNLTTDGYFRLCAIVQFTFVAVYVPVSWWLLRRDRHIHADSDAGVLAS